ncbi:hypothetical protein BGZ49_005865 [Haplosporangium sp. Z 27]|nr:hypothetical protein BGZ49_005865 [Haplosporangium sp. Z 27]
MRKLTSQESESSRNEYEFLVQQIDLLHRQLQLAQRSQMGHANDGYRKESIQSEQPDTTKQLQSEIKELTKSLKNWQIAFQQAEEKYRRKCDGERTLKQTLRKRETQLFSLVEKLNRYEMECESSIASNKGQLRQSSELEESPYSKSETSEDKKQPTESSKLTTSVPNETIPLSSEKNSGDKKHVSRTLPKEYVEERVTITKGQLVMAIFSWAVAYVLP